MRVLQAVVRCEFEPISELAAQVPPELVAVVDRCLAKDLEERYSDGGELSRAIGAIPLPDASGVTVPVTLAERPAAAPATTTAGGLARLVVTGLVALLVGGVGGFLAGRGARAPAPPPAEPVAALAPATAGRPMLHASVQPAAAADGLLRLVHGSRGNVVAVVGSAVGPDGSGRPFPAWAAAAVDELTADGVVGEELIRRVAARGPRGFGERLGLSMTSVELESEAAELRVVSAGNPYLFTVSPAGDVDVLPPSEGRWNGPGWRPADHRLHLAPGAALVVVAGVPDLTSPGAVERVRGEIVGAVRHGRDAIASAVVAAVDRLEAGSGDRVGLVVVSH
jgi:hypothetical protein